MTWLRGPPLLVACYDNKIADVRALLASGADPRAAPSHDEQKFGSSLERTSPSLSSCIFSCIHFGYFEVLEVLLATGQYDLADAKRAECVALAARLLAGHRLGPQSKRFFQLICECGGDSEKAAERLRAGKISKTQSRGSSA